MILQLLSHCNLIMELFKLQQITILKIIKLVKVDLVRFTRYYSLILHEVLYFFLKIYVNTFG